MYFDFATWSRIARLISREPLRLKRAMFLWTVFVGLSVLSIVNLICLALDHVFFPRFRDTPIEAPIFVVGNGRSGTTHIQRILSADGDRFSYFKTWQLMVPSILQHKALELLAAIDRRVLGGLVQRRLRRGEDQALEEVRKLHDWQSTGSEEDDFVMFTNWSSVSLTLPFPYAELEYLFWTDREVPEKRRRILGFYRSMLQRLLFARREAGSTAARAPSSRSRCGGFWSCFPMRDSSSCCAIPMRRFRASST